MTDLDINIRLRRAALYNALQWAMLTSANLKYEQLHVFIQGEIWERHLKKVGFHPTVGKSLIIEV